MGRDPERFRSPDAIYKPWAQTERVFLPGPCPIGRSTWRDSPRLVSTRKQARATRFRQALIESTRRKFFLCSRSRAKRNKGIVHG